jgi:hypothetical protein
MMKKFVVAQKIRSNEEQHQQADKAKLGPIEASTGQARCLLCWRECRIAGHLAARLFGF